MGEDEVKDLFRPVLAVRTRRMFGGLGVYDGERMFALVVAGGLFMKADAATRAAFEAAGSSPFAYQGEGKLVTTSYWRLPEAAFDDEEQLRRWTSLAREAAARAASKTGRGRRTGREAAP